MRLLRRRRKQLNPAKFTARWQGLQKHCSSRKTWPQAITEADDLLHDALKSAKYKGKTMGERLVAAQHDLTANDLVWLGHKLSKRISQEDVDVRTLKKQEVLQALAGFRQALRDLGALES